jgi:hypothetical protein
MPFNTEKDRHAAGDLGFAFMKQWALLIGILVFCVIPGCGREPHTREAPPDPGRRRVLLAVPTGYKIVNETDTILILRADRIRITIASMEEREFQIWQATRRRMTTGEVKTQFGDLVAPAVRFKAGETSGWKFAILAKDTSKTRTVDYLLTVKGGRVQVGIQRDDDEPFDEVALEPMLATIAVGQGQPLGGSEHEMYGRKAEYDLTTGPARLRIFADNYQFLVYDFASNPFEPRPHIDEQTSKQGYTGNKHALWIFTRAHNNVHRLDVRLSARYVPDPGAMRQTVCNLRLPTGTLALFEHPDHVKFRVPPGDYMIYCRAYHLGKEGAAMFEKPDDEFFKHDEWERYELIIVPGVAGREGQLSR